LIIFAGLRRNKAIRATLQSQDNSHLQTGADSDQVWALAMGLKYATKEAYGFPKNIKGVFTKWHEAKKNNTKLKLL